MRRTRAAAVSGLVIVLGIVLATCAVSGSKTRSTSLPKPKAHASAESAQIPAVESGLLPWRLPSPISRLVALPGPPGELVLLGGLVGTTTSADGAFTLQVPSGTLTAAGTLASPVHDASGAVIEGEDVVFGGGSPSTVATVQELPAPAGAGTASPSGSAGRVTSELPSPRSDSATATVGGTTYLVGGYDGSRPDPAVLATTDGRSFRITASLPVPVRYPAVAALAGKLYVFGGQAITGSSAGQPVDDVQVVNPAAGTASVVAHLPEPLSGAVDVSLGGHLYVAGGESSAPQPKTPGVGTTQLSPTGAGANPGAGAGGAITDSYFKRAAGATTTSTTVVGGGPGTSTVSTIWAFDPASDKLLAAGRLQVPVSHAAVAVSGSRAWIVGGESGGSQVAVVQMFVPDVAFGTAGAPGAGSPYFGAQLLVADRGNNRLLVMDAKMDVVWTYPSASVPADPLGFYFPDDAFFVRRGTAIISNQEQNETIVEIAYPSGKIVWSYGHPKQSGSAPGYLHEPDDAYLLPNGQITVADAQNCRVLVLDPDGTVVHQIGTTGRCVHAPPVSMGSPNGDTPLADGNLLISEINGSWISEYTLAGALVWTEQLPITYPSDPQQLGPDLYLAADYARPGQLLEFDREGHILYRYDVASGPGMLDHPSLAEKLPSGAIMINDDYANRMVAIDPATDALVWQYGVTDLAGTATGMLNTPDGFDILLPDGSTPTHPATG
ncbi:MAG TPA: hypothetical protein VMR97_13390 [Acidimicrobiales bacterium]|nr:hypothetical protein [Acidimicrobiales bacterium]